MRINYTFHDIKLDTANSLCTIDKTLNRFLKQAHLLSGVIEILEFEKNSLRSFIFIFTISNREVVYAK